jgi:hypothetical protein
MRKLILAFSALILASGMVKPLSGRIIPTAEAQPVPCSYDYQGAGCPSGRPEISAKVACSPNQYNGGSNGITNPLGYESEPMLNATNNTWIYSSCVPPPPVCPANYIQSGTPTWLGNQWSQPSCTTPPHHAIDQSFQLNVQAVNMIQIINYSSHPSPTHGSEDPGQTHTRNGPGNIATFYGAVFESNSFHVTSSYNLPGGVYRVTFNNRPINVSTPNHITRSQSLSVTVSGYRSTPTTAPTLSCSGHLMVTLSGTSFTSNSATLNLTADYVPDMVTPSTGYYTQAPPLFTGMEEGYFLNQSASCTLTITQ